MAQSRLWKVLAIVAVATLLAACGNAEVDTGTVVYPHAGQGQLPDDGEHTKTSRHPSGYFEYSPPLLPIAFSIDSDGKISVTAHRGIYTPIGTIQVGIGSDKNPYFRNANKKHQPLAPSPYGTTQLLICQQVALPKSCKGYRINSGRRLTIAMNGQFVQTVERNRIVIDAYPEATITVTDSTPAAYAAVHPAARADTEEFDFKELGNDTEVDVERSLGGTTEDLSYDHLTGEFKLINGAMVSRIKQYAGKKSRWSWLGIGNSLPEMTLPSELDCKTTKPATWQPSFTGDDLKADVLVACIGTPEGDYGYLVIGRNKKARPVSYYVYSHIWVR